MYSSNNYYQEILSKSLVWSASPKSLYFIQITTSGDLADLPLDQFTYGRRLRWWFGHNTFEFLFILDNMNNRNLYCSLDTRIWTRETPQRIYLFILTEAISRHCWNIQRSISRLRHLTFKTIIENQEIDLLKMNLLSWSYPLKSLVIKKCLWIFTIHNKHLYRFLHWYLSLRRM